MRVMMESILNRIEDLLLDSLQRPRLVPYDLLTKVKAMEELENVRSKLKSIFSENLEYSMISSGPRSTFESLRISSTEIDSPLGDRPRAEDQHSVSGITSGQQRRHSMPDILSESSPSRRTLPGNGGRRSAGLGRNRIDVLSLTSNSLITEFYNRVIYESITESSGGYNENVSSDARKENTYRRYSLHAVTDRGTDMNSSVVRENFPVSMQPLNEYHISVTDNDEFSTDVSAWPDARLISSRGSHVFGISPFTMQTWSPPFPSRPGLTQSASINIDTRYARGGTASVEVSGSLPRRNQGSSWSLMDLIDEELTKGRGNSSDKHAPHWLGSPDQSPILTRPDCDIYKAEMERLKTPAKPSGQPCSPGSRRIKRQAPPPPDYPPGTPSPSLSPQPSPRPPSKTATSQRQATRLISYGPRLQAELIRMLAPSHPVGCLCSEGAAANKNGVVSVVKDLVRQDGLDKADYCGWLVEVDTCERKWCVVADMLFCVFTSREQQKAQKVLILPSHSIRTLVFVSAKRDSLSPSECLNQTRSAQHLTRTISGTSKYQLLLENSCAGLSHAYGVESRDAMDRWRDVLTAASNLDVGLFCSEKPFQSGPSQSGLVAGDPLSRGSFLTDHRHKASCRPTTRQTGSQAGYEPPSSQVPGRLQRMTSHEEDPSLSAMAEARGPLFTRVARSDSCKEKPVAAGIDELRKAGPAKVTRHGSFENLISLLRRKKGPKEKNPGGCCHSNEEQNPTKPVIKSQMFEGKLIPTNSRSPSLRRASKNVNKSKAISQSVDNLHSTPHAIKFTPRISLDVNDLQASQRTTDTVANSLPSKRSPVSPRSQRSATTGQRPGLGSRLALKATLLKDRVFGWRGHHTGEERVSLAKMKDIKHSGALEHKQMLRWLRLHCVVEGNHLYGFKSHLGDEAPVFSVLLRECSLSLCGPDTKSSKKIYMFKLCQFNARGHFFCARSLDHLSKWIDVLKKETSSFVDLQLPKGNSLPRLTVDTDLVGSGSGGSSPSRLARDESLSPTTPDSGLGLSMNSAYSKTSSDDQDQPYDGGQERKLSTTSSAPSELQSSALSANSSVHSFQNLVRGESTSSLAPGWDDTSSIEDYDRGLSFKVNQRLSYDSTDSRVSEDCADVISSTHQRQSRDDEDVTTSDMIKDKESEPGECLLETDGNVSARCGDHNGLDNSTFSASQSRKHSDDFIIPTVVVVEEKGNDVDAREAVRQSELRRRSLSTGDLSASLTKQVLSGLSHGGRPALSPGMGQDASTCRRPRVPNATPARQVSKPTAKGYLDYLDEVGRWISVWCVLKDQLLLIYRNPREDSALDTLTLPGVIVRERALPSERRSWQLELIHQDYAPEVLRAETETERNVWLGYLQDASLKDTLEGLNLEKGTGAQFDNERDHVVAAAVANEKDWQRELIKIKKQCLLEEVLKQKEEIERRQGMYKPRQENISEAKVDAKDDDMIVTKDDVTQQQQQQQLNGAEKQMLNLVHLKQRKVSTQLKFDSLNKSLQAHQAKKNKKRGFWFSSKGSDKSVVEAKAEPTYEQEHLEAQLQVLHEEMNVIDKNLVKHVQSFAQETSNPNILSNQHEKEARVTKRRSPVLKTFLTKSISEDADSEGNSSKESSEIGSSDSLNKSHSSEKKPVVMGGAVKRVTPALSPVTEADKQRSPEVESRLRASADDGVLLRPHAHAHHRLTDRYSWSPNKFADSTAGVEAFATLRSHKSSWTGIGQSDADLRKSHLIPQELVKKSRQLPRPRVDVAVGGIPVSGQLNSTLFEENYSKSTMTTPRRNVSNSKPKSVSGVPRCDEDRLSIASSTSSNGDKRQISEDALQKIAAFEELLQDSILRV